MKKFTGFVDDFRRANILEKMPRTDDIMEKMPKSTLFEQEERVDRVDRVDRVGKYIRKRQEPEIIQVPEANKP